MPRRYAKKKRYGRRTRKKGNMALYKKPRSLPFPKTMVFKTRYYIDKQTLSTGIGGTNATRVFSASDIFDPETSGVGHQPVGYDQVAPLYNHFTVVGSKIMVRFTNITETRNPIVGISVRADAALEPNSQVLVENGRTNYKQLSGVQGTRSQCVVTNNYSARRWFGVGPMSKDELRGNMTQLTGGSPADNVYYHVWVNSENAAFSASISYTVDISYTAILSEPKTVGQS